MSAGPEAAGGDMPEAWVHPDWIAALGGDGRDARRALSRMLGEGRMRPAARRLAMRHGVDLRLEGYTLADLDATARAALSVLSDDGERFVRLLGHVALRAQVREGLIGSPAADGPAFDRALSRIALTTPVEGLDTLSPPATGDVEAEGWSLLAAWLRGQKGANRAYLRLALPARTGDRLRSLPRRDDGAGDVVGALLLEEGGGHVDIRETA